MEFPPLRQEHWEDKYLINRLLKTKERACAGVKGMTGEPLIEIISILCFPAAGPHNFKLY